MDRDQILLGLQIFLLSLVGTGCNKQTLQQADHPNIIYIMADDMGYADLGSYGNSMIETPNLDRMAEEGIRFTQHYAGRQPSHPRYNSDRG